MIMIAGALPRLASLAWDHLVPNDVKETVALTAAAAFTALSRSHWAKLGYGTMYLLYKHVKLQVAAEQTKVSSYRNEAAEQQQAQTAVYEAERQILETENNDLSARLASEAQKRAKGDGKIASQERQLRLFEQLVTGRDTTIGTQAATISHLQTESERLAQSLTQAQTQNDHLQTSLATAASEKQMLGATVSNLQGRIQVGDQQLQNLQHENSRLFSDNVQQNLTIQHQFSQNSNLRTEHHTLNSSYQELLHKISAQESDHSQLEQAWTASQRQDQQTIATQSRKISRLEKFIMKWIPCNIFGMAVNKIIELPPKNYSTQPLERLNHISDHFILSSM